MNRTHTSTPLVRLTIAIFLVALTVGCNTFSSVEPPEGFDDTSPSDTTSDTSNPDVPEPDVPDAGDDTQSDMSDVPTPDVPIDPDVDPPDVSTDLVDVPDPDLVFPPDSEDGDMTTEVDMSTGECTPECGPQEVCVDGACIGDCTRTQCGFSETCEVTATGPVCNKGGEWHIVSFEMATDPMGKRLLYGSVIEFLVDANGSGTATETVAGPPMSPKRFDELYIAQIGQSQILTGNGLDDGANPKNYTGALDPTLQLMTLSRKCADGEDLCDPNGLTVGVFKSPNEPARPATDTSEQWFVYIATIDVRTSPPIADPSIVDPEMVVVSGTVIGASNPIDLRVPVDVATADGNRPGGLVFSEIEATGIDGEFSAAFLPEGQAMMPLGQASEKYIRGHFNRTRSVAVGSLYKDASGAQPIPSLVIFARTEIKSDADIRASLTGAYNYSAAWSLLDSTTNAHLIHSSWGDLPFNGSDGTAHSAVFNGGYVNQPIKLDGSGVTDESDAAGQVRVSTIEGGSEKSSTIVSAIEFAAPMGQGNKPPELLIGVDAVSTLPSLTVFLHDKDGGDP